MTTSRKRIVITGMGILSSLADNLNDFKEALINKQNGVADSKRFSEWFEKARAAEVRHEIHCPELSEDIIHSLDNAALWAYKVGKDALEQAGLRFDAACLKETGLIVGVSSAGTEAFLPIFEQRIHDFSLRKALYSGGFSSCSASVSTLLGLQGGVELVATACTASPNAVGMAFDYIQNGKSKTMLAVGTEPIYLPTFAGFYALNVMHPDVCTPFSGNSGMSIGEGAGALVLEDYDHAVARGATIYGEILSYATSCDAFHETGPDPRASGAVQVMFKAMQNAGITPDRVDYVNAHGTGTEANDRIETLAMKKVFAGYTMPPVSSTKSYFGHNIGAAGIVELIACLVTLPDNRILPTLNFTSARPNCDLDYVPNAFVERKINIFMKNNYAFGGNNCSMILSMDPGSVSKSSFNPKRVAITGIGAVTAIGHTVNDIVERVWKQQHDIELGSVAFPADTLEEAKALLAVLEETGQFEALFGESHSISDALLPQDNNRLKTFQVTGLEPRKHLRRFDPRKATRGGTFALIALSEALNRAKKKIKRDGDTLGLIVGMSSGPQETTYKYLQSLKPDPRKVRTSEFPGSLMNAIPTFCGISEGIKGYTTTLATGENAAMGALTYGYEIIRQDLQPQVLVGGADEYFPSMSLYMDAVTKKFLTTSCASDYQIYGTSPKGYISGEGACMLLLEDPDRAHERGAEVLAEIVGYGKSCSNSYFDTSMRDEKSASMALAIARALHDADLMPQDIDLVCGTSNGSADSTIVEINALHHVFSQRKPDVSVVNYNACFGFVASSAGLLNLMIIIDCFKKQAVPAIPYTAEFFDSRINFVRTQLNMTLNHVLLVGATENGNYYAFVIKGQQ